VTSLVISDRYRARLTKAERLHHNRQIDFLRAHAHTAYKGRWVRVLFCWLPTPVPATAPIQLLLSVGKRRLRRAADRNRVKRQLREAYRLQKACLYPVPVPDGELDQGGCWAIQIIFLQSALPPYAVLAAEVLASLQAIHSQMPAQLQAYLHSREASP
jgi:ribonuclease P protein component